MLGLESEAQEKKGEASTKNTQVIAKSTRDKEAQKYFTRDKAQKIRDPKVHHKRQALLINLF